MYLHAWKCKCNSLYSSSWTNTPAYQSFYFYTLELSCVCVCICIHTMLLNGETKKIFKNFEISLACAFLELDTHHCVHRLNQNNVLKGGRQIPVRGHRLKQTQLSDLRLLRLCGNRPPHFNCKLIKIDYIKQKKIVYCEGLSLKPGKCVMFTMKSK